MLTDSLLASPSVAAIRALLDGGAELERRDDVGRTPLALCEAMKVVLDHVTRRTLSSASTG